jgi:hypothetical protein
MNWCRRSLLAATVTVGLTVTGASLGAGEASAAKPADAPAVVHHQENVIEPSYYVTPDGERLSAAAMAADSGGVMSPAALPVYLLSTGQEGLLAGIHACKQTGTVGGVTGVVCSDLYAEADASQAFVNPAGEGYCQTPDGLVQCPAIKFMVEIARSSNGGDTDLVQGLPMYCGGSSLPKCQADVRNEFINFSAGYGTSTCDFRPGWGNEYWTVVLPTTIIALPGKHNTSPPGNVGSPHAIVCHA